MATLSNRTSEVGATGDADGQRADRTVANGAAESHAGAVGTATADTAGVVGRTHVDGELAAPTRLAEGTTAAKTASGQALGADQTAMALAGPRPRASLMATLSLVLGVAAALLVLTGVLAGPGVALGLLAAIVGLAGVAATSKRHVAGKSDALLGGGLGLGAIVVGVLALTGNLSWLNGDTNQVMRVHDWIAVHASWLLP